MEHSVNFKAISDDSFADEVEKSKLPVLVDFHATWCGPCRMLAPMLTDLAKDLDGKVKFVSMDIDDCPETPSRLGVRAIPCLVLFKDGNEVDRKVGATSHSVLSAWLFPYAKAALENFEPTYPVFENPGVEDGILKKDNLYILFLRGEVEVKQEGVFKTVEEAKVAYMTARPDATIAPVYELREVKEMKLVKIS